MYDVILSGHYGHRNFGDDLIMSLTAHQLAQLLPNKKIAVVVNSGGINYARKLLPPSMDILPASPQVGSIFLKGRYVLFGGGGLFFDFRTGLSLPHQLRKMMYYLRNYAIPHWRGVKFAGAGIGLGPFGDRSTQQLALLPLRYFSRLWLRDLDSYHMACDTRAVQVRNSCDLSLLELNEIRQHEKKRRDEKLAIFVIRNYRYDNGNSYVPALKEVARSLEEQGYEVKWCSFQPDYDEPALKMLDPDQRAKVFQWDPEKLSFADMYEFLSKASFVVSARLHALFVCAMLNVPVLAIGVDPKLMHAAEISDGIDCVPATADHESMLNLVQKMANVESLDNETSIDKMRDEIVAVFDEIRDWIGHHIQPTWKPRLK